MIVKIGRYKFEKGSNKKVRKLCPLSLEEIKTRDHVPILPNGKLLIKKPDYALFKVARKEPVVQRMLKLTNNGRDKSKSFIIIYVGNAFVGYKSKEKIKFIPSYSKRHYIEILEEYTTKKAKRKKRDYRRVL